MSSEPNPSAEPRIIGRYALHGKIASGGMATVYLGRLLGPVGFARTVAIKRLHPHLASDPQFVAMLVDEARLAARIRHPNVVSTLDVVATKGELFIVMEYVQGESMARLSRSARERNERVPPRIAVGVMIGVLNGLHAAHEAKSESGEPLDIVHRDVSPQNILVGVDGVARVLDFGVAKASGRIQETSNAEVKGKLAYMAPEQLGRAKVDRRTDVFAASIVLWEALAGRRMFQGEGTAELINAVLNERMVPLREIVPELPEALSAIVARGLDRNPARRWPSGREMAVALEHAHAFASGREIGEWVERAAAETIGERARHVAEVESQSTSIPYLPPGASASPPPVLTKAPQTPSGSPSSASAVITSPPATQLPISPMWAKPRSGVPLIALIALGAAVLLGVAFWLGSQRSGPAAGSVPNASVAAPVVSSARPVETVSTAVAPSTATQAPSITPTAATETASAKPSATPTHSPVVAAKPDCDNPFTVDSAGIRRPRPECFAH